MRHGQGFLNSAFSQITPKNRSCSPPHPPQPGCARAPQEAASYGASSFSPQNLPLLPAIAGASFPERQPPPCTQENKFPQAQETCRRCLIFGNTCEPRGCFYSSLWSPGWGGQSLVLGATQRKKLEEPQNSPDNEEGVILIALDLLFSSRSHSGSTSWNCSFGAAQPSQRQKIKK